jgi:transposase
MFDSDAICFVPAGEANRPTTHVSYHFTPLIHPKQLIDNRPFYMVEETRFASKPGGFANDWDPPHNTAHIEYTSDKAIELHKLLRSRNIDLIHVNVRTVKDYRDYMQKFARDKSVSKVRLHLI